MKTRCARRKTRANRARHLCRRLRVVLLVITLDNEILSSSRRPLSTGEYVWVRFEFLTTFKRRDCAVSLSPGARNNKKKKTEK